MPVGPARMPLFDHLGELRMRFVRIVVCLLIAVLVFYLATPTISQFLIQPISDLVPTNDDGTPAWVYMGAFDAFGTRFVVAMWAALVACMPVIIWQTLAFFLPALKPNERKWFIPTFAIACALFIFGTVFCYLIILHPAFEWLTEQGMGFATILPEAKQWIDIIIKFEIGFGFAFELPLVVFYLTVFEVVPYSKLRGAWRTVYIVLMVISALITPDASPITMLLLFGAMIGLYEVSMLAARLVLGGKIKKQKEELARQEAEDAEWEAEWAERQAAKKAEAKAKTAAK